MCRLVEITSQKMASNLRHIPQASTTEAGASFQKSEAWRWRESCDSIGEKRWRCFSTSQKAQGGKEMFVCKVTHQQMFTLFGLMFGLGCCVIKVKLCVLMPLWTNKKACMTGECLAVGRFCKLVLCSLINKLNGPLDSQFRLFSWSNLACFKYVLYFYLSEAKVIKEN